MYPKFAIRVHKLLHVQHVAARAAFHEQHLARAAIAQATILLHEQFREVARAELRDKKNKKTKNARP